MFTKHLRTTVRPDWLWVVAISAVVCLISSVPYLAGMFAQTPESHYAWVAVQADDILSYFAKMQQGYQGDWLFHLPYTAETHVGVPVYTYYLFLGHIARVLNLPIPLVFHLARVIQGFILLLTAYVFISRITDVTRERRFIFLLVCLSSGVSGIPESNTFYTLMDNPHFALSQALLIVIAGMYLRPPLSNGKAQCIEIGILALSSAALAIVQPHMTATALGTGALFCAIQGWRSRRIPWHVLIRLAASAVAGLGISGALYLVLNIDPVLRAWQQQNVTLSPPIWLYLIGYGLLLVPAIWGGMWAVRRRPEAGALLLAWCIVTAVGLYAPTSLQRRLISGVHVPLAILAGLGICRVWVARWHLARYWAWAYLAGACALTAALVIIFTRDVTSRNPRFYLTAGEDQAIGWLRENAPTDSVVLSSPQLGRFIPAFAPVRVVIGHWAETVNFAEVLLRVKQFYSPTYYSSQRCNDVAQWGADYIIVGPRERDLGAIDASFSDDPALTRIAQFNGVIIYQARDSAPDR